MNVSCPGCATIYRIDPAKVPAEGVRARCSACSGVIAVGMAPVATSLQQVSAASGAGVGSAPLRPTPAAPFVARQATVSPTPQPRQPLRPTPPAAPRVTPISVPAYTPPSISSPHMSPPVASPSRVTTPPRPAPVHSTPPRPASPSAATVWGAPERPVAMPKAAPVPPAPGERRPVNPFLTRDPGMRARRLARALVSDMVAYYPAKHAEGLDKGTLKELFKDEIKKSYEEYTAQVGADFARTTTHFQESLNEVLGAGKKIF